MTSAVPSDVKHDMKRELDAWRAKKDRELQAPDSPLAFTGRFRLKPGRNSLGSAPNDDVRLVGPGLPEHALDLLVQGTGLELKTLLPIVAVNDIPVDQASLHENDAIDVGPFHLVYQGGLAFQVFDRSRPEAVSYHGLNYLPVDARYRVKATFEPAEAGKTLILETTQYDKRELPFKGVLHFTLHGHALTLDGFQLGDNPDLFVIFRDATSGKETYGAGRFLWVKAPVNGKTIVDFNQAWNPLCAYSELYNCPLAPSENRLTIPIPVGEAPYHH